MTRSRALRRLLGVAAGGGVAALALLAASEPGERVDRAVSRVARRLPDGPFLRFSRAVAASPHEALASGAVAAAALVLLARSRPGEAGRLVLVSALAATGSVGLKRLLRRPRPPAGPGPGPVERSGRFPSGHTTSAAIAALAAARALAGTGPAGTAAGLAAGAGALAVGVSRLHLVEHYASDVLASFGLVLAAGLAVPRRSGA